MEHRSSTFFLKTLCWITFALQLFAITQVRRSADRGDVVIQRWWHMVMTSPYDVIGLRRCTIAFLVNFSVSFSVIQNLGFTSPKRVEGCDSSKINTSWLFTKSNSKMVLRYDVTVAVYCHFYSLQFLGRWHIKSINIIIMYAAVMLLRYWTFDFKYFLIMLIVTSTWLTLLQTCRYLTDSSPDLQILLNL